MKATELKPTRETVDFDKSEIDSGTLPNYTIGTAIDGTDEDSIKEFGLDKMSTMHDHMIKKIDADIEQCADEYMKMFNEEPNEFYFRCTQNDIYKDTNPKIRDGFYRMATISVGVGKKNSTRRIYYTVGE